MAFPIADGAGTVSTLIGVISSLVFALIPSTIKKKKKVIFVITVSIIAGISLLGAALFFGMKSNAHDDQITSARQSRPLMNLQGDVIEREALYQYSPTDDEIKFISEHQGKLKTFTRDEWKHQLKSENLELVIIDFSKGKLGDQPNSFSAFTRDQEDEAVEYIINSNNKIVLFNDNRNAYTVRMLKLLYEETGKLYSVFDKDYIEFADPVNPKRVSDFGKDIFNQNLYELRSSKNIRETHTTVNAKIFTEADLSLTPIWKMKELFEGKKAVFVDYYDDYDYSYNLLSEAGITDYSFVKGGLRSHFKHSNLTPNYYNNRIVEPELITRLYREGSTLRFICMAATQCLDNLPANDTYIISYRDMKRSDYYNAIRALPRDYEYVTVSSNQETSGLAIITGYLLIESGHNYLGELPAYSRFSLENIRHHVAYWFKYDTSLAEYQQEVYSRYDMAIQIKHAIGNYGWVIIFCLAGILCRVICFPLQYMIYKSYYQDIKLGVIASLSGLAVPVLVVLSYITLDAFVSNYAVIPHTEISGLFKTDYEYLKWIFVGLVALQSFISFPERKAIAAFIVGLVFAVYAFGYMDLISLPMMCFLLAGECVSIILQSPFYLSYRNERRRQDNGWALKPIKDGIVNYPEKWLYLAKHGVESGVLVSTSMNKLVFVNEVAKRLPNGKLIVRSCSSKAEENALGGYFESYSCSAGDAFSYVEKLKAEGCDYVMIQAFVHGTIYGAASSVSLNGKGISLSCGEYSQATEGGVTAISATVCRKQGVVIDGGIESELAHCVQKVMLKLEQRCGFPVTIEFALFNDQVKVLQIREQKNTSAIKVYPGSINDYVLAEDYIAKCSHVTGGLLEQVTQSDFAYIDGFVYKKLKSSIKGICTVSNLKSIGKDIEELLNDVLSHNQNNPSFLLPKLESAINLYSKLYASSQSIASKKVNEHIYEAAGYSVVISSKESEVDVFSNFKHEMSADNLMLSRRDYNHHMIVLCNYIIHRCICGLSVDKIVAHNLNIMALVTGEGDMFSDSAFYADQPITEESKTTMLSPGVVSGKLWDTAATETPKGDKYVLIGEEVSSQWVKHLSAFSGIVSVYGNENSHLAISARSLGIPYMKVSRDEYDKLLKQGNV